MPLRAVAVDERVGRELNGRTGLLLLGPLQVAGHELLRVGLVPEPEPAGARGVGDHAEGVGDAGTRRMQRPRGNAGRRRVAGDEEVRILEDVAVGRGRAELQRVRPVPGLERVVAEDLDRNLMRVGHRLGKRAEQVGRRVDGRGLHTQVIDMDPEAVVGLAGQECGQAVRDDVEVLVVECAPLPYAVADPLGRHRVRAVDRQRHVALVLVPRVLRLREVDPAGQVHVWPHGAECRAAHERKRRGRYQECEGPSHVCPCAADLTCVASGLAPRRSYRACGLLALGFALRVWSAQGPAA